MLKITAAAAIIASTTIKKHLKFLPILFQLKMILFAAFSYANALQFQSKLYIKDHFIIITAIYNPDGYF